MAVAVAGMAGIAGSVAIVAGIASVPFVPGQCMAAGSGMEAGSGTVAGSGIADVVAGIADPLAGNLAEDNLAEEELDCKKEVSKHSLKS